MIIFFHGCPSTILLSFYFTLFPFLGKFLSSSSFYHLFTGFYMFYLLLKRLLLLLSGIMFFTLLFCRIYLLNFYGERGQFILICSQPTLLGLSIIRSLMR